MNERNPNNGQNLLELCCYVIFEKRDERYLLKLIDCIHDIKKYLVMQNDEGSLPIFRILHLFQSQLYESKKNQLYEEKAQKILNALIKCKYDFLERSSIMWIEFNDISTLEALILSSIDPKFFKQLARHLRETKHDEFYEIVDHLENCKGQIYNIMLYMGHRTFLQRDYANLLEDVANKIDTK